MSETVKRYNVIASANGNDPNSFRAELFETAGGSVVHASDHDAAIAAKDKEIAGLHKQLGACHELLGIVDGIPDYPVAAHQYSAEVIAANWPNRIDDMLISGPYVPLSEHNSALSALRAEVERMTKDAKRWRYVMDHMGWEMWSKEKPYFDVNSVSHEAEATEASIDAAMEGK
jgi:hypothetical protein